MSHLETTAFTEPGLYLLWPDGNRLDLTRPFIEDWTERMLQDPGRIPPDVRMATDYQPCDICPERDRAVICHAIMPALPFLGDVDRYLSYERVTAIYRENGDRPLVMTETTMQEALKFIAILSLMQYCETGRKFAYAFNGVNPLLPSPDLAEEVFRRVFVDAGGDLVEVATRLDLMRSELLPLVRCQLERLRLICRQDALCNAFVSTYTVVELLFTELEKCHAVYCRPRRA